MSSISLGDVPLERRLAMANKLKKQEEFSSDEDEEEEEETNKNIRKNKKPPHIPQQSIPAGHTSNSAQETRVEFQRLEAKLDNLATLVKDMANRNQQVEQVLSEVAERTGIRHNLWRN